MTENNETMLRSFRPDGQACTVFYKIKNDKAEVVEVRFDFVDNIDYDKKGEVVS